ncbi:MAG: lytic transglycosylase domain-containing protein [Syntrophales bacterium]|nr:lytic transglycosylase domain-containing protein [Syntrophales bacterium]
MKGFITLILAGAIGLLVGYIYFGSGHNITAKDLNSGVETVREKVKTIVSAGQPEAPDPPPQPLLKKEEPIAPPFQLERGGSKIPSTLLKREEVISFPLQLEKGGLKIPPPQQKAAPMLPEKTEAILVELSEKREIPSSQDNKGTSQKPDWNAKDIDVIFKILNGAQDRLVGKSIVDPQEEDQEGVGTDKAPVRPAPSKGAKLRGKSAGASPEAHSDTGGMDDALIRQARNVPLKKREVSQAPKGIKGKVSYYASKLGMKESLALAMCHVESGFNPRAVSHKGALGLMQVMPGTANIYGVQKKDLMDPDINIRTGLAYYRDMHSYFQNEEMALAAYNCGPARVLDKKIPTETRIYIRDVKNMERYYARRFI